MSSSNSENPACAFDDTLEDILELLEEDNQHFIYLTGAAGTGKTTLIERVKDECLLKKMVVAPTGVAALNIGGSTINSACLLYTSPSPRDRTRSRMPSSA